MKVVRKFEDHGYTRIFLSIIYYLEFRCFDDKR